MKRSNSDVREFAKRHRVYLYEVGAALGFSKATFSRRMCGSLSDDFKDKIFGTILKIESDRYETWQDVTKSNEN